MYGVTGVKLGARREIVDSLLPSNKRQASKIIRTNPVSYTGMIAAWLVSQPEAKGK